MSEKIAEIKERFEVRLLDEEETKILLSELDRITAERDKAIEGLRYYAKQGIVYRSGEDWHVYHHARTILKELGVDLNEL